MNLDRWPHWVSDDGAITLINADCLALLSDMEACTVDALITDPPYCSGGYMEAQKNTKAQGLRGATVSAEDFKWFTSDNMGTSGLVWMLREMMVQCHRILKPNRSAFVFTDWRMIPNVAPALESGGMRYRNMIVWDKGNAGLGVGFKPAHEIIMEFCNGSTEYQCKDGQNVLRSARLYGPAKVHGAQKPVEVIAELIRVSTPIGGTVLDAFGGSGTTAVAASGLGRRAMVCERDPGYFEIAKTRIQKELDQRNGTGPLIKATLWEAAT